MMTDIAFARFAQLLEGCSQLGPVKSVKLDMSGFIELEFYDTQGMHPPRSQIREPAKVPDAQGAGSVAGDEDDYADPEQYPDGVDPAARYINGPVRHPG